MTASSFHQYFTFPVSGVHRLQRQADQFLDRERAVELCNNGRRVRRLIAEHREGIHGRRRVGRSGNLPLRGSGSAAARLQVFHLVAQFQRNALGKLRSRRRSRGSGICCRPWRRQAPPAPASVRKEWQAPTFGPTPLTPVSILKQFSSETVANPNRSSASSRTFRCV